MTSTPKEASKLGQYSWALFDWANQPFFTVIITFIFGQYFANVMVGDVVKGQAEWVSEAHGVNGRAGKRVV